MFDRFKAYIDSTSLFDSSHRILLAVSGGVDSVVMLDLFGQSDIEFAIAHCNFNLRGHASDQDEMFVKSLAKKYNVRCYSTSFDTQATALTKHISTQMAARQLRYDWFESLLSEEEFDFLATAHHMNDLLETALFNMTKGTGLKGLRGMLPKKDYKIRPLLFAEKSDITNYAQKQKLEWREDASNASNKYSRNLIRNAVIPQLSTINPDVVSTFSRNSKKLVAAENILEDFVEKQRAQLMSVEGNEIVMEVEKLEQQVEAEFLLYELIKHYGFNFFQTEDIFNRRSETGKIYYSKKHQLLIDRGKMIISSRSIDHMPSVTIHPNDSHIPLNEGVLHLDAKDCASYKISPSPTIAALDFAKLKFPLEVRRWQHGDWFYPLGMDHKKKLSDFFIDEKIGLHHKDSIQVLVSGSNIVWVIGHRIDNRFKIVDETTTVLELKIS